LPFPYRQLIRLIMDKPLDVEQSHGIAKTVKSKAKANFENTHKAALQVPDALYVQGFVVMPGAPYKPREHSWLELADRLIDVNLPHLSSDQNLHYFPAQRLTVKQLKQAIETAKEDYPEDPPLPIYGDAPYEYYGDVMLGGQVYQQAYEAAAAKCRELNKPDTN
jgi:hypothetical protein